MTPLGYAIAAIVVALVLYLVALASYAKGGADVGKDLAAAASTDPADLAALERIAARAHAKGVAASRGRA
jgi:hypothetical protein